jgi:undecaprenyl diphosphate synthase
VAIIMDGNGRWAIRRGLERFQGHQQGARVVEKIVHHCVNLGLDCLTLYSFSMQNWKRPKREVNFLMQLYTRYLVGIRNTLKKHNVRLVHLGRTERLPAKLIRELNKTVEIASKHTGMMLALALNYGSREEIVDAVKKICRNCIDQKLAVEQIDERCISENLCSAGLPDPDLLIRTSNEKRLSNFLLWQISYAEFYVTDTLWPDFTAEDLDKAVIDYSKRSRRLGDVKPTII